MNDGERNTTGKKQRVKHRERLDREREEKEAREAALEREHQAEEAARQRRELHQKQQRDERIRERDRVVRGGGNPNDDLDIEPYEPPHWQGYHLLTIPKLKF